MNKTESRYIIAILTIVFCLFVTKSFGQNVIRVQVGSATPAEYADFNEGWDYAMSQQSATITLLSDITRTQTINYRPAVADGRHTLDLNNHTITDNTSERLLLINKENAKLTITDNSPMQGGCLYKQQESVDNIYVVVVQKGEVEIAGGKIYCENTYDDPDDDWHPAIAVKSNADSEAVIRVSGGMIEAVSKATAYAIAGYSDVYITDGHLRATVTKDNTARALSQQMGIAHIYGGTFEAFATGTAISACTVSASSWIGSTPESAQNGEVYIHDGTFLAATETSSASAVRTDADVERRGGEIVKARGKMHISGGTFTVRAPSPSARQIFAAVSNGARLFDNDTPHHLIDESLSELTISGGNFLVDTRDTEGNYVENDGNVDLLRNWGKLDISGGTFTIYQYKGATGIGCYRNKVTVTGNPTFNIHGAYNTRGVIAGPWNHEHYCDADTAKNKAEIEIYGGTFTVVSDSAQGNSIAVWASGGISSTTETGEAGYAMLASVTIHDGQFTAIHPTYSYACRQDAIKTGAYGTAEAKMIISGGKFQALTGTEAEPTPNGKNINSTLELAYLSGGYYVNYSQLATHINNNCRIRRLTDADPEYAEGYRYTVELGPRVAKLTVGADEYFYSSFARPFNHAQKHSEATITLLDDIDYIGEVLYYDAAPDNASTTLDLNGYSAMPSEQINAFLVLDKDNTTFTFKDSGTGGVFGIIHAISSKYLLVVRKGKAILESGTLYGESTVGNIYAIYVQTNATNDARFEMKGGKIHAVSIANTYALLAKNSSTAAASASSLTTIAGGEIEASSTGSYALAVTSGKGGDITIHNHPKISATSAISETQAVRVENNGKLNINGGLFYGAKKRVVYCASEGVLAIRGGFYNELSGETFRNQVETYCVPPYHTFPTTSADSYYPDYAWKVEPLPESGFYADIIDVDNTNKTLTLNVSNWDIDGWPYYINNVAYAKTARAADRTMKIPYTGEPGDAFYVLINKNNKYGVTTSHRSYIIPQEITTPFTLTADQTMPLFVKGTDLTVDADIVAKNIYIAPDATLTINSGKTLSVDTLFLRTTPNSAATLNKSGNFAGSSKVCYTRIIKDKSGYFPFGLPLSCPISAVRLSNGVKPGYMTGSGWVLRYYDEAARATNGPSEDGNNWQTLVSGGVIDAGKGYEMYSGVDYYREYCFPVNINELTTSVPVTHTDGHPNDAGWNVLVSPLTHTITNSPEPEGLVVSWMLPDGSFEQEIPSAIPPVKTFAYQAASTGTLSFDGSSVSHPAPRRMTAIEEQNRIQWIHLDIADANGEGDQTSIYSHPTRYVESYQTGIDVAKQSLTASRAIIYSSHAYGNMAFVGVSDGRIEQGVALTIYSPSEQELTFSLRENDWLGRLDKVWLIDKQTGARINLRNSDYTFHAVAGTMTGRFMVQGQFSTPQECENIENESSEQGTQKLLINNTLYIRLNGRLYDVMGKLITKQ